MCMAARRRRSRKEHSIFWSLRETPSCRRPLRLFGLGNGCSGSANVGVGSCGWYVSDCTHCISDVEDEWGSAHGSGGVHGLRGEYGTSTICLGAVCTTSAGLHGVGSCGRGDLERNAGGELWQACMVRSNVSRMGSGIRVCWGVEGSAFTGEAFITSGPSTTQRPANSFGACSLPTRGEGKRLRARQGSCTTKTKCIGTQDPAL